ncbi:MAG: ABC transporter permease [Nocardiaceae bacterium]|nr:ABC transporter permease [Nocardiaceae bacterium]
MKAALQVEAIKLIRSTVGIVATISLVVGITALCGGMMAAVASGDPQLTAKLGPDASLDWAGLLSAAAQITGAGGLLGFAVVAAWLFGREFADGTITSLFALPVSRSAIAAAKLVGFALWAAAVSLLLGLGILLLGIVLGFGVPDSAVLAALGRQTVLGIFSAAVAVPVAWVATATRSLLGGVACGIFLVVIAQVGVLVGAGQWMPIAAPALWAMSGGADAGGLVIAATFSAAAVLATLWSWHRLELNR